MGLGPTRKPPERAEKSGVSAKATVRRGVFTDVLKEVIVENQIDTVVLGSASEETGTVSHEHLQELSEELGQELGVEFIVVQDGKMVFQTET